MTDLDTLLAELAAANDARELRGPFYDDITALEAAKRYSNRDLARFHYYNDNGYMAEWRKLGERLIAHGRGFAAYGDFGTYEKALRDLAAYDRKRVGGIEIAVALKCIRQTIDRGNAFLVEQGA